jgi:hypothetical protein
MFSKVDFKIEEFTTNVHSQSTMGVEDYGNAG